MIEKGLLRQISGNVWEIGRDAQHGMNVPARVYTSEEMIDDIAGDRSLNQLMNVACLPGIRSYALAMPDVHEGYGFPVGGVAAFGTEDGVISPGGIGYDINCGVRLLSSQLRADDIKGKESEIAGGLFGAVPSGVGQGGRYVLTRQDMDGVLSKGAGWALSQGYATRKDIENTESRGCMEFALPGEVSDRAKKRGKDQLGTLGGGNHFLEVLRVDTVYEEELAEELSIQADRVVLMIHTGSRGLGHQIATDYVKTMMGTISKYEISLPDRELACAPFRSEEGQSYFGAMACGANYAWANRQVITHAVRGAWEQIYGPKFGELNVVYDVAHNIAKLEEHSIDGRMEEVVVHRKGATRAFPGQPVIIPGSMGTSSYVLVGGEKSMKDTFGSSCHGAGRRMSRSQAKREVDIKELKEELLQKGIFVQAGSYGLIAEESPNAYKDVDSVVDVVSKTGIARKVCGLLPMVVVIG